MLGIKQLSLERSLERTSSLGLLPSINRPPSQRALFTTHHWPLISETTASLATCFVLCLLIFAVCRDHARAGDSASVLGKRSWKDVDMVQSQRLQIQLEQKDEEVQSLRAQLGRIVAGSRRAESNMASQEMLITSLQQRQDAEKSAKHKALYALAERSRDLEECAKQTGALDHELALCQSSIESISGHARRDSAL